MLIILFSIVLTIGIVTIAFSFQNLPYEKYYFEKMGIEGRLNYYYNDLVSQIGFAHKESIKESSDDGIWTEFAYDGFLVTCWEKNNSKKEVLNVIITSKELRFGKYNIGIGSTILDVERAYRKAYRVKDNQEVGFIDGDVWIDFKFDSNNEVKEMCIYYGP